MRLLTELQFCPTSSKMPRKHRFSGLFFSPDRFESEDERKSFG